MKYKFIEVFFFKLLFFLYIIISLIKINIYKGNENESYFSPKISIYLPIYNKEKYLIQGIKSIQMQTLKNIEIIAINDYSDDSSLILLKNISRKEPRIKIFNNYRNYGLLYTRTIGILKSSGEYIMNLDPDDTFANKNSLKDLYNAAKKLKLDIISFGFLQNNKYDIKCDDYNQIVKQPLLFNNSFNHNNLWVKDYLLWNKIFKRELILKAYNLFKSQIYLEKWNYGEDTIWSILIHRNAKSMICLPKIIYIYNKNKDSLMNNRGNNIEIRNRIYILKMLKEIFKEQKEYKYIEGYLKNLFFEFKNYELLKINKGILKNKKDLIFELTTLINFTLIS